MSHLIIKLPDIGEGMAQAELASWLVHVGDTVAEDQNLAEVTTDKATVEIPSPAAGKVLALHGTPGDMIAVGSRLIELETAETVCAVTEIPSVSGNALDREVGVRAETQAPPLATTAKTLASPAVRARASDLRIDLADVVGTGAGGRITHKDLDTYLLYRGRAPAATMVRADAEQPDDAFKDIKLIGIRRKIAERMQDSKRHIPHYAYVEEVDVTALEDLRLNLNANQATQRKLTVLPFIATALAQAVRDFPQVNAHFDDKEGILRQFSAVHIGIATQTDKGLMVPVVFHAERLELWSLAAAIVSAAESARSARAERKDLSGSTITVTSLGKLGGIASTPVINRPEVAIIGVNRIVQRPVARDGQVVLRNMMNLSSSFDHRIVDGSVGAAFIQRVKALLEQPALLFMSEPSNCEGPRREILHNSERSLH